MGQKFVVQKIKVKQEDELTDVVSQVTSSKADSIVVIFSEPSDLLVSSINLQVIQDSSDEKDIPLVFQIFDSRAGLRNAATIHSVFTDKAEEISNDLWDQSYKQMKERQQKIQDSLKGIKPVSLSVKEEDVDSKVEEPEKTKIPESVNDSEESQAKAEFRDRIDKVLEKSKKDLAENKHQTVETGGLKIAMDHDIKEDIEVKEREPDKQMKIPALGSRDLMINGKKKVEDTKETEKADISKPLFADSPVGDPAPPKGENKLLTALKNIGAAIGGFVKNKKVQKMGLIFILPVILIVVLVLYIIYRNAPRVNVEIFIESRPIEAELEFTGSAKIEEFNLEELKVPVMKQTVKKERSDATNATGTASRGQKASGMVEFFCVVSETKTLTAGTTLTAAADGLQYVLVNDVLLDCPSNSVTGTVEAAEYGGEYNISSGIYFDINSDSDVGATSATSFTGGMIEEYTVISTEDFNRVVNPLKETSFNEAESELEKLANSGWVIIPSTIKSDLDGEVITDYPIGAEVDIINVTVKTISSALYYKKSDIEAAAKNILLGAAEDQKLFESSDNLDLQLGEDFKQSIEVTNVSGNNIKVTVKLSGAVKPLVEKEAIVEDLAGMSFDDGLDYLSKLDFVSKDSTVKFSPDYFPDNLRYFPDKQGKLMVKITEVIPEEEVGTPSEE